jgi:serine/threonine-protein kinase
VKTTKQQQSNLSTRAAAVAACLGLGAACTSVRVKPFEEEQCKPEAIAAMALFGLKPGNYGGLLIDIHQPGTQGDGGVYPEGPLTSVLEDLEHGNLPTGTLLFGTLWTSSGRKTRSGLDKAYGRYTEAQTPDGLRYPICFILGNPDGVPQEETSQPGVAVLPRSLPFMVVKRFVFE